MATAAGTAAGLPTATVVATDVALPTAAAWAFSVGTVQETLAVAVSPVLFLPSQPLALLAFVEPEGASLLG